MIFALIVFTILVGWLAALYTLAWVLADVGWQEMAQHKCGHVQRYSGASWPCGRCGERDGFRCVVARRSFPLGWEIKDSDKPSKRIHGD